MEREIVEWSGPTLLEQLSVLLRRLSDIDISERVELINKIRLEISKYSPLNQEPIDCVLWKKSGEVKANDYNPNFVAPPEMILLEHSIRQDGYTQPIVTWKNNDHYEVVDGFHRNRVGKDAIDINNRIMDYLPITIIKSEVEDRNDRIASTIRHNRARGKHAVEGMSDIVIELKNRNWKDARIAKELGMEQDEILRLCQITGLAGLFKDQEFSKSWDIEESADDFVELEDNIAEYEDEETKGFRTANTDDEDRIFHKWNKWECHKAGFYKTTMERMTTDECERAYCEFLSDITKFSESLEHIITEWKHSCEHYLTNKATNRIAWLGQAAMCYATGVPSKYRSGFNFLTSEQQEKANNIALVYLNKWLKSNQRNKISMEEAMGQGRQVDLY